MTNCWMWDGKRNPNGYAQFHVPGSGKKNRKNVYAHRYTYEYFVGPIPVGLEIDHLCRNRGCVRPEHLEPVTTKVNSLRSLSFAAVNAKKTHCPRGHPLAGDNLIPAQLARGNRECRVCYNRRMRDWRRAKA